MGKLRERMSFSRIDEVLEMPNLIEVQKNSYQRFLDTDLREVLADVSPITDYNGNLVLEFVDYSLDEPKNSIARCRERDITYAAPLKVFVRLKNKETGEIKESDVFMGDFPLMTDHGTFIINGWFVLRASISTLRTIKPAKSSILPRSSRTAVPGLNMRRTPTTCCGSVLTVPANCPSP